MGQRRNAYEVLMGKPKRKRLRRKLGYRWKDDIKISSLLRK
jgi:hypothetical protein